MVVGLALLWLYIRLGPSQIAKYCAFSVDNKPWWRICSCRAIGILRIPLAFNFKTPVEKGAEIQKLQNKILLPVKEPTIDMDQASKPAR
jgi:hypothetical protein